MKGQTSDQHGSSIRKRCWRYLSYFIERVVTKLTVDLVDDTISPAWYGPLRAATYHIADMSQRCQTPPSSRGPGRGPLKAQTGVRIPMGAQKSHHKWWLFFIQTGVPIEGTIFKSHGGTKESPMLVTLLFANTMLSLLEYNFSTRT
jgi:hypothetical protein